MSSPRFPFELPVVSKKLFELAAAQSDLEIETFEPTIISAPFLKQAVLSHLSGFAYRKLSPVKGQIEPKLWKQLELQYVQLLKGNHQFLNLHQQMVALLEANKIQFAVLKGLDLLFRTYREEGIRHISDIDLLILPEDLQKVTDLFEAHGFKCNLQVYVSKFYEKHIPNHAPLQASFNGLNIDVHVFVLNKKSQSYFSTNDLILNREKIFWNDQYTYVLEKKNSALFVILHLHKHIDHGNAIKISSFIDVQKTISALDYPNNKAQYPKQIQVKIEYVIDCMVWLGLLENDFLPQRKKAPARYFFYLLFFLQAIQPTFGQTLRYKFFPRLFLYQFSWKTLPLLFHEVFPSKRYLLYSAPNSSYLGAWLKRLQHFTRKK